MKLLVGSTPSITTNVHKDTSSLERLAQNRLTDLSSLDCPRSSSRPICPTTGPKRFSSCSRVHLPSWKACHAAKTLFTISNPSRPSRTPLHGGQQAFENRV